jgi:hypothetical protein
MSDIYTDWFFWFETGASIEDVEAASELYDALSSGGFYQRNAEAQVEMWGTCQESVALLANEEREKAGLPPVDYPQYIFPSKFAKHN